MKNATPTFPHVTGDRAHGDFDTSTSYPVKIGGVVHGEYVKRVEASFTADGRQYVETCAPAAFHFCVTYDSPTVGTEVVPAIYGHINVTDIVVSGLGNGSSGNLIFTDPGEDKELLRVRVPADGTVSIPRKQPLRLSKCAALEVTTDVAAVSLQVSGFYEAHYE